MWTQDASGVTANSPVSNSPTGGNLVAFDGDKSFNASLSQTNTRLTPGSQYCLTFYQAAAQQNTTNDATTEQWLVTFANQTRSSTQMSNVNHGWVG